MALEWANQSIRLISSLLIVTSLVSHCDKGPGAQSTGFGKVASETLGRFVTKPMTRSEACQILSIEETPDVDPQ